MIWMPVTVAGLGMALAGEAVLHRRTLERIPLRIAVAGTRGKSTVVRMLAAALRADGRRVVAKTTGTEPRLILPDGGEEAIRRHRLPSILEQKAVVRRAVQLGADVLICEMMSIHAENHRVESGQLLRPHLLVLINALPDHLDAQGHDPAQVAEVLAQAIPSGGDVVLPASILSDMIVRMAEKRKARLIPVDDADLGSLDHDAMNRRLAQAAARHLGVGDVVLQTRWDEAAPDPGAFRLYEFRQDGKQRVAAVAFAANDPASTWRLLAETRMRHPGLPVAGLLCLRGDRADRSALWLEALQSTDTPGFDSLFVMGGHARAVARRLPKTQALRVHEVETAWQTIHQTLPNDAVVFGFGNWSGPGRAWASLWQRLAGAA